jgi:hypothetical protein
MVGGYAVTFIEYQYLRDLIQIQVLQDPVDGGDLDVEVGSAAIDDMEEQVGIAQFFQCRTKGTEEVFGKVANKSDCIGDDDFLIMWEAQAPAGGVEGFKDAIVSGHLALGQRIQQGRLASVGIPDNRDDGYRVPDASRSTLVLVARKDHQLSLQVADAISDSAAVSFQLRFPRASRADPASQSRQARAVPREAWQQIAKLCEFDLDLSFTAVGSPGEDVEDQLSAVDDFDIREFSNRPGLGRREVLIEDQKIGSLLQSPHEDILEFSAAQEKALMTGRDPLDDAVDNCSFCGGRQFGEFDQAVFLGCTALRGSADENGGFLIILHAVLETLPLEFGFELQHERMEFDRAVMDKRGLKHRAQLSLGIGW